jgi:cytochrome c553
VKVPPALALAAALAASGAGAQEISGPRLDYVLQCMGCHLEDGSGAPGRVPSLAGVAALLATPEGRARLLSVPGVRQASLSDERLAALLSWTAAAFAPPGEAPAFAPLSAEEVARYRGTSQRLR